MTMETVEFEASELDSFVADLGFATVFGLQFEEVPQPALSSVAILNLTGWCTFTEPLRAGLCVMVVGRDKAGGILWACCMSAQPCAENPQRMLESLLVAPEVLGKTEWIAIRVYGGRFVNQDHGEIAKSP